MKKPIPARQDYLDAFIKTAQYLAGLTTKEDMWNETGKVLVNFFGAALCVFGKRGADGEITGRHWTFPDQIPGQRNFGPKIKESIAEVLESSFLASRVIFTPDPLSVAFLPISQKNQITDVMLVGHRMSEPIPKELLNVYLAVARLVGTTAESLASEIELRKHRDHLDELVRYRTAELTKTNEQLQQEIIERKQVEAKLRESEAEKKAILDGMTTNVRFVNKRLEIIWINKAGLASVNKSLGEVVGHKCFEFWGDDRKKPCADCPAAKILRDKKAAQAIKRSPDGRLWNLRIEPVFDEKKDMVGLVEIANDITDKARLEASLQHAKKMEAIATLAGGVAHEFNNALMGIMGNIQLLEMDLPADERRDRCFETMRASGYRMSRLTDRLLAYAQGGKYRPENLKLDAFVMQTLPILQHDLKGTVRVETALSRDVSYIKADNTQMQLVLSAILANSNDAMEESGLIRITAEDKEIGEDFVKQHPGLRPGLHVCLSIEDNGKGMDEETRKGIFEPFFTTKFQGRGMGMAAVYGIVKNHNGWISVDSDLGKGTMVRIYLPAVKAGMKARIPEEMKKPKSELGMGEGTILVIEDDEVLLEINRAMLERLGYRVLEAKTGGKELKSPRHMMAGSMLPYWT